MTRYYFNLYNDETVMDDEGRELPDLDAARAEALKEVRALAADHILKGRINLNHRIEVTDGRAVVATVRFGDGFTVEGGSL